MRSILLGSLFCIGVLPVWANVSGGLKAAMEKGQVKVVATTTGKSYHSKALKLQLSNTTKERLQLSIDPALIFTPLEPGYQDLVLPAEEMIALAPGATAEIEVQTFCGKLHASAPGGKLTYKLWKQGDSTMIKVTQYIRKHNLYDGLGQNAIWALTDGHDLDGIIDPERPKISAELLALMTKLTGRPTPEYFKLYKLDTVAGQPVFQKRVLKIIASIEWKLEAPKSLTLGIYNQEGSLVQGVFEDKPMAKGGYKMQVQFEAEGAPPGNYFMRLRDGNTLMKEIKVTVD
jgi:hypothetical protein